MAIDITLEATNPLNIANKRNIPHPSTTKFGCSFIDLEAERQAARSNPVKQVVEEKPKWVTKEQSDYSIKDAEYCDFIVNEGNEPTANEVASHTEEIHYFNNTSSDFYITSNNGLCRILQGNETIMKGVNTIVVKRVYVFSNLEAIKVSLDEFARYVKVTGNKVSDSSRIVNRCLHDFYTYRKDTKGRFIGTKVTVSVDYTFNPDLIPENGIYVPDLDIVMSGNRNAIHPRDVNFKTIDKMSSMTEKYGCTGIVVEMVDNEKKYDPKFVYVAGQVQKVTPITDKSKKSGVTLLRVNTDKTGLKKTETISFMSIDEALEKGIIHSSHEAAATNGDPSKEIALAIETKKKENMVSKFDYDKSLLEMKAETDKLIADLKIQNAKLEQDQKEMENEYRRREFELKQEEQLMRRRMMHAADEYEYRSYRRKDNSEAAKSIPAIITAIAATAAAVLTFNKLV